MICEDTKWLAEVKQKLENDFCKTQVFRENSSYVYTLQ